MMLLKIASKFWSMLVILCIDVVILMLCISSLSYGSVWFDTLFSTENEPSIPSYIAVLVVKKCKSNRTETALNVLGLQFSDNYAMFNRTGTASVVACLFLRWCYICMTMHGAIGLNWLFVNVLFQNLSGYVWKMPSLFFFWQYSN